MKFGKFPVTKNYVDNRLREIQQFNCESDERLEIKMDAIEKRIEGQLQKLFLNHQNLLFELNEKNIQSFIENQEMYSLNKEVLQNLEKRICNMQNTINSWKNVTKRRRPLVLLNFVYHLADHCNLNCKCCDHFSPIAENKLANITEFEKDMCRLGELCSGYARRINLQGGEPLLNPNAIDFAIIARRYFPNAEILFTTNGILLNKQTEEFWEQCKNNNISIEVTKYPINVDYEEILKIALNHDVNICFYGSTKDKKKTTYYLPLDLEGKQDINDNFDKCFHANNCIMLKQGRLYTCTIAANVEHFNYYFNKELYVSNKDSISIYEAENLDDILQFLAKPIPFCRYCRVRDREYELEWEQTKRNIKEWT